MITAEKRRGATKVCPNCKLELHETMFLKWFSPSRQRIRRAAYCTPCRLEKEKDGYRRRKYGITSAQFDQMLKEQDGLCAICLQIPEKECIDHDHVTGKVRAILCNKCNTMIGQAQESPETLRRAAKYIELHK